MRKISYNMLKCIFLTLLMISCSDEENNPETNNDVDLNLNQSQILNLVNEARASGIACGSSNRPSVDLLEWNDALAKAALDHSNDMEINNYFSHTGLDGSKFSQRAEDAGYTGSPVGENIAIGYSSEDSVIKGWLESTGHCNNIMNERATEIGIARSDNGRYWTMILGAE